MVAWPLAQGSISRDSGFPKPDCAWGFRGYSSRWTGGWLPRLSQPPLLHTSPISGPLHALRIPSPLGSSEAVKRKRGGFLFQIGCPGFLDDPSFPLNSLKGMASASPTDFIFSELDESQSIQDQSLLPTPPQ